MKLKLIEWWNRLRGYGFYWQDGAIVGRPGTCPYPLRNDWSAAKCVKAGLCGCDERRRAKLRIDWKSVAQKRLRRIRELEQWQQARRCQIYNELRRELGITLHAKCIANSEILSIEIARVVSERMTDL